YGHLLFIFFFSSRRRHTRWPRDWSSDVCSSDLPPGLFLLGRDGRANGPISPGQNIIFFFFRTKSFEVKRELNSAIPLIQSSQNCASGSPLLGNAPDRCRLSEGPRA